MFFSGGRFVFICSLADVAVCRPAAVFLCVEESSHVFVTAAMKGCVKSRSRNRGRHLAVLSNMHESGAKLSGSTYFWKDLQRVKVLVK